jgi:hypothetical protein
MIDLTTTNVLLGIMAFVSLLEAAVLIGAGVMGLRLYRELTEQIRVLESRHVAPLSAQANQILQTVQRISERVEHSTTRVDAAVEGTVHGAEVAVDKVQGGMRKTAGTVIGVVRGVRTAIETFLADMPRNGSRSPNGHGEREPYATPPSPAPPTTEPF